MNNIDYIEEAGQYYCQCVTEACNIILVDRAFTYKLWGFYNIVHTEVSNSNPIKEMKVYGTVTKHVFKYSMN